MKKAAVTIGGLIIFACCVLLMERLLRIFQVVATSTNPASDTSQMIVNLLPYYLGIAVPMALLLGVIITVDRFSRSSELTAAFGSGISLFHMTKPFLLLGTFLAVITLFIEGYMQPVGRYNYRQVEHSVKQQSFTAALREGTFTSVGNRTFFAGTDLPGAAIGPIFIYEKQMDGYRQVGVRLTTASQGEIIIREKTMDPVLQLSKGQIYRVVEGKKLDGDLQFESSSIAGAASPVIFRQRGDDEREMTSLELLENRKGNVTRFNVNADINNATLHLRLAKSVLLLILPFIAVPFGLNYGRNPSSAGIAIGVIFLISLQKALEFGQSLGAAGKIPPWAGIWPIIIGVALFALWIFRKSAYKMGQPPLTSVSHYMGHIQGEISSKIKAIHRFGAEAG
ncbi:LptF/LptG family permease [Hellea balneolensis]|uniref:LptF/LptG family permease n=1 Tax=Hellea balneolensis TaxID=287478 RepID=UPI00047BA7CA|nr:LptF/LptG family permease [Hellea balneolensis]